jgi:hypothetical protein
MYIMGGLAPTHPPYTTHETPRCCCAASTSRQHRKLIFGMQTYFDPTRQTTSKKMKDDLKKKSKNKDDLKKNQKIKTTNIKLKTT